jgi:LysM repeat protein
MGILLLASLLFPAGALAAPEGSGDSVHVVQWGETLTLIAGRYGVSVDAILAANGLHDPNFVYVGQRLVIPIHAGPGPGSGGKHTVAPGETLTSIALRYATTVGALAAASGLGDTDLIYVGQVLNVPGVGAQLPGGPDYSCLSHHTVGWGDTLSGIAWRYHTTANALMQANNLYGDFIFEGQRLCVPPGGVAAPAPVPSSYYTVQPGDTLSAIAWRFGVSQAAIIQANNMANASFIFVGQRLLIPGMARRPPHAPGYVDGAPAPPPGYAPPGQAAPAPPPGYQPPQAAPAPAPGYQPPSAGTLPRSSEPVVIPYKAQWVGTQTANNPDPDEITTLVVMTHEKEKVDVFIRSGDFVARGVTGVYYEYSWIPTFAFRGIPGGEYEVWVDGEPSQVAKARVDPGGRTWVEFKWKLVSTDLMASPSGWVGEVVENTSGDKPIGAFSILVVRTGAIGNKVRVTAPGGFEALCITGTKLEHGPGACDVGGLNAGTYHVILDGAGIAVELYLDGIGTAVVEFRPAAAYAGAQPVSDP